MSATTTSTYAGVSIPDNQSPDIQYHPSYENFIQRRFRRLAENSKLASVPLPDGFPKEVSGPIVWEGKDWKSGDQWVYKLSGSELTEINDALGHFRSLNIGIGYVGKENFPLPILSPKLRELAQVLYSGRGFFVIRTIPIDDYSREDLAIIYAGISSHIGSARGKQDGTGAVLAHIKDLTISHVSEKGGIGNSAYTTDKQVFHTDVGDLIALMALEIAEEGGTSRISSAGKVYNVLAATRPDLVRTLSEPWPLDSFGGDPGYTTRPLLYFEDGHIVIQYSRRHFTGYGKQTRSTNIPPITEAQAEALDAIHFLAEEFSLALNFQKGDIQYINSMGLLHARDAFKDSEQRTRHLIRLWLRNDQLAWKTPKPLQSIWQRLYSVGPEEQRFPLEPEIRRKASGMTK
ncbi:hypothetical protein CPB84DRAFT_1906413 [Gymnopilus junonius]|uniref:TauD/TfdA-like domain-containing protein n=1 Tax=Gymnopilus junonius TaxID=109634 RepID=A0A9P5TG53_GYMJU|nr:hypothetical protein CPB84DRAFT_1906413 [Gymnopilus junonius]